MRKMREIQVKYAVVFNAKKKLRKIDPRGGKIKKLLVPIFAFGNGEKKQDNNHLFQILREKN